LSLLPGAHFHKRSNRWTARLAGLAIVLCSGPALAHGEHHETIGCASWQFEPSIVILTLFACAIYGAGMARRRALDRGSPWRHVLFFAGVAALFFSLESPVDALADHLFWVHQIQHMLLRMIGPMLIALSAPQAMLVSGLPAALRRGALAPFAGSGVVRALFAMLAQPAAATALFVAALFVWQYPPYHDAAVLDDAIHHVMHVTMLTAGLIFWWRVFDLRPPPMGLAFGTRLMMLWIAILGQIVLGAYTTLKGEVLYPAYDAAGRLFGMSPLADELIGGFIIWVPSSMMCLAAAMLVIHRWGVAETRAEEKRVDRTGSNAAAFRAPTSGAELIAQARPKNRMLAVGAAAFAIGVFGSAILVGVLAHLNGATPGGLFAHVTSTTH